MAGEKTQELKFWEKPNTVAIYSAVVALFIVLVLSSIPSASPPVLKIEGAQVFIIVVIAALLLFRYYNTLKLGTLLELSNAQKEAEEEADASEQDKTKIEDGLSNVKSLLEDIDKLIGKAEQSESAIKNYISEVEREKEAAESEIEAIIPKAPTMLKMGPTTTDAFNNLVRSIRPKIEKITDIAEDIPKLETATTDDLKALKSKLEAEKRTLEKVHNSLDERVKKSELRRQRLAALRNELLRR